MVVTDGTPPFFGRDADLKPLQDAWDLTLTGAPQVLALLGDSGVGKTRLVQEFYRHLTTQHDPEHYWPDVLPDLEKAMTIVPAPTGTAGTPSALPWLWLAIRCRDPGERNRDGRGEVAFDAVRPQLQMHLAAFYAARGRRTANRNLLRALVGGVTSFAVPGSSVLIQALNTALDRTGDAMSAYDTISAFWERYRVGDSPSDTRDRVLQAQRQSLVDMASQAFRGLCDPEERAYDRSVPVVLVVDDAQWADALSVDVLERLCGDASIRRWRLLVVVIARDEAEVAPASQPAGLERLLGRRTGAAERGISVRPHLLRVLPPPTLARIVTHRLPRIGAEAAALLAKRCSGDIDLLNDFIAELEGAPPWLRNDGTLAVVVGELETLPSKASEMARRRLRSVDRAYTEVLTWAAAQGVQFDELFVAAIRDALLRPADVHDVLRASDQTHGITSTHQHPMLISSGEFRRYVFWEVCAEWFERSPHRDGASRALAQRIATLFESADWPKLDVAERSRLGQRLLELVEGVMPAESQWRALRVLLLSKLAQDRLRAGDAKGAGRLCQRLLTGPDVDGAHRRTAWLVWVKSAYMLGEVTTEQRLLEEWGRDVDARGPELHLSRASLAMRQSQPEDAIAAARLAMVEAEHGGAPLAVECGTTLAHALWVAGKPHDSQAALLETETRYADAIGASTELQLADHHTAALALHDLECNAQVVHRARVCVDAYRAFGDRQSELISLVNLGDALWGIGRTADATRMLQDAYEGARDADLPHALDVAAICLANARASAGELGIAVALYREGIDLAHGIGHDWDALYGEVYLALATAERGDGASTEMLWVLSERAADAGYHYLAALANAFAPLAAGTDPFAIDEALAKGRARAADADFPGPRAHLAALAVLRGDTTALDELIATVGRCEGIKGRRRLVLDALAYAERHAPLGSVVAEFVRRWRGRFGGGRDGRPGTEPTQLRLCDYRTCEARCCYDGVYLEEDEVDRIRAVVTEHPEAFAHLPDEFIVQGTWYSTPAPKTAVRPHRYSSPDFPAHFGQTRCVFALDDGACSLQTFATGNGIDPWKLKPRGCWMHPLAIERRHVVPPARLGDRDASFKGIVYPGFASFTPCGQDRDDGADWRSVLRTELERAKVELGTEDE